MCRNPFVHIRSGFTLMELMTVLVIIGIMSAIGMPMYRDYVMSAKMAESIVVVDAMDKNQQKYFAENGTYVSLPPNPAAVPGIASPGESSAFASSDQWQAVGFPIPPGSAVLFSYQTFAGQTQPGTSTPIEENGLYAPNTNMDLERTGLYNAGLDPTPLQYYALHANDFQLDFGFMNWNACAAGDHAACVAACRGDARCEAECPPDRDDGGGDPYQGYGNYRDCIYGCQSAAGTQEAWYTCSQSCSEDDDGDCTTIGDSDCEDPESVQEACQGMMGAINATAECQRPDGECQDYGERTDTDCYPSTPADDDNEGDGKGEEGGGEEPPAEDEGEGEGEEDPGEGEGEEEGGSNACASFGVSTPNDFGVDSGISDHAWFITTAVGNFEDGANCTLVAKVVNMVGGQNAGGGIIQIRE